MFSGCGSKNNPASGGETSAEMAFEDSADKTADPDGVSAENDTPSDIPATGDTPVSEISVPAITEAVKKVNADIAAFYDCVDVVDESGMSLGWSGEYLALNADGTGEMFLAMDNDDEAFQIKWTSDGDKVHIYDPEMPDDEGVEGAYSDGIIRLDMGGGFYMILSDDTTEEWKKWKQETDKFISDFDNGAAGGASEVNAPNGTGGIAEETLYMSLGEWRDFDDNIILNMTEERFSLTFSNGSNAGGSTKFVEKDGLACLELISDSGTLSEDTYIHPDGDRIGHMLYVENGTEYELIYQADLTVNQIMKLPAANGYDGTPLSAPVSLDMTAKKKLTDVRFLKLEIYNVRDDGELLYNITELLTVPSIDEGGNFSPTMEFAGDLPGYGIAYKDERGFEHFFSISLSGKDGSVVLAPFSGSEEL